MAFKLKKSDDYRLMGAAIAVRDKLKSGQIRPEEFNMRYFKSSCGTVRCIGGHMAVELKNQYANQNPTSELDVSSSVENAADRLFYPNNCCATTTQAVRALNNFIKGNSRPWDGIKLKEQEYDTHF